MRRAGWFALLISASALAVAAGDTLTVRARNTRLRASPAADAKVLQVLQPGQTVTFQGRDEKNPEWLKVKAGDAEGVVYRSALADTPTQAEVLAADGGTKVDVQAFASSGAATRAFSPATATYAEEKVYRTGYDQLLVVTGLAKSVTDADVETHAKSSGLVGGGK